MGLPVAAVEVVPRDLSRTLSTSASVESRQTTRLAARLAGTVDEVFVTEGDLVEKGAVLIRLDTREIETELQAAEARKNRASQEYERAEELLASNLVSEAEYALRRTDLQIAEAEVAIWQTRVSFSELKAPRKAVVSGRFIEPGEGVDARETLLELIDVEHLIIPLGISERDIVHLETGQTVPITLDAFPDQEWEGTLQRIFPKANPDNRMVTVEIAFPSQAFQEGVRPGFLARVRLPIDQREDALAIPSAAIGEDGEETYVYVIADDILEKRIIERGLRRGEWTEVVSGLEEGEIILATNPIDQEEGTRVRIVSRRG